MWTTTTTSLVPIRSCTINIPSNGLLYVHATASLAVTTVSYEAHFRISGNNLGIPNTDRRVDVLRDNSGKSMHENLSTSAMIAVAPGVQTITLEGFRRNGTGIVSVFNPTLVAVFIPDTTTQAKACADLNPSGSWTNNSTTFSTLRSCNVTTTQPMIALVDASANAYMNKNLDPLQKPWEGQFRLGMDNPQGSYIYNRWIDLYPNTKSSDPTNYNGHIVADNGIFFVPRGTHTFYFAGRKFNGDGIASVYSSSLSVILIPAKTVYIPLVLKN